MVISPDISSKLAVDAKSVDDLHLMAKKNPDEALQKVAQQFEALFMNMLLKSMREATPKDGIFDSQQTQFFTQMYDQQLAQKISTKGIGIADMMVQQLSRNNKSIEPQTSIGQTNTILSAINSIQQSPLAEGMHPNDKSGQLWSVQQTSSNTVTLAGKIDSAIDGLTAPIQTDVQKKSTSSQSGNFIDKLLPHAKIASESTGIPPNFMLAQAALESGWGKHEIRHADNSPTYNLFGIKAGANWKGDVVEKTTTEYINGVPQKAIEKFRAYSSYAEGFNDYAKLLMDNPRYAKVLNSTDAATFANGLQRAGYATDPMYAEKLMRILNNEKLQNREFI
ncbi:MAG: flagellar assembly peptidoglycan hydrolase FlgJ [Nitrosomonas sp.]|uniref:flagellar assembly peptidoglycan hydrolase FlgJ n=1 Tax=Nitrosomonas sp. TaxID=42353 RepID=UPI0025F7881B|nr:flagellar assembly peptidoglycan hydrolase FlgJ [Nitrosomonas sp.]MCG7756116.1 flagellar assembly peptidoglycan hydrolase FlgJ [Nitrosomonas sp.]UJP01953.1 MAG: flagellar assembly peptidoglycan hydrolase FlgJ [Nitrosomonas sp.]